MVCRLRISRIVSLLFVLLLFAAASPAAWHSLGGVEGEGVTVNVLSSDVQSTVLEFRLGGFFLEPVLAAGLPCSAVTLPGAVLERRLGMPELPTVGRSVIIPEGARMAFRVLEIESQTLDGVRVVPSKGELDRNTDPATVPYTFGPAYSTGAWYPAETFTLRSPFVFRDLLGQHLQFRPFRSYPLLGTLEVCRRLVVEVYAAGEDTLNVRQAPARGISDAFAPLYARSFANYEKTSDRYEHLAEPGRLARIVAHDAWLSSVQPLADWKEKKGIETVLVTASAAGGTPEAIKSYLSGLYSSAEGLTYAILVGDVQQIGYFNGSSGSPADSIYARLDGTDLYPEIYISRISAQSAADVDHQVEKFLAYERFPVEGASWYHEALGIGSNEGSPTDAQRMDQQLAQLEGYGFTNSCRQYQGQELDLGISACLNDGRSICGYYGHGSGTSWGSVSFGVSNINALTNGGEIPWIFDASCLNGDYRITTCFAEAWLRAVDGDTPSGALACYMGTTNESWDPPVYAAEEAIDLLTAEEKLSCGGLYYGGSMHVCDLYSGGGEARLLMDQCVLFGDASLEVRTAEPVTPAVGHPAAIPAGPGSVTVTVQAEGSPMAGALVCLRQTGHFHAWALTDSQGSAIVSVSPTAGLPVDVTVTGRNLVPYEGTAAVGAVRDLIVAGPGPEMNNPSLVRVFSVAGGGVTQEGEFTAYTADRYGVNVAAADIDGDLSAEVLTGPGPGRSFGPLVRAFELDGQPVGGGMARFMAYGTASFGVNVAGGNLDGVGVAEIVTGPGPGAMFGPHVRAFRYDPESLSVSPLAQVSFLAYGTNRYGVRVACGDVDGDGRDEILTSPGPAALFGAHVRGWNADGAAAAPVPGLSFLAYGGGLRYGAVVACGDIDGDGRAEILTGPGPDPAAGPRVRGWRYTGTAVAPIGAVDFTPYATSGFGVLVAVGDLDEDGIDEILTAPGPGAAFPCQVRGFNYDGEALAAMPGVSFLAFDPALVRRGGNLAAGPLVEE